jgi:hypothetical protein
MIGKLVIHGTFMNSKDRDQFSVQYMDTGFFKNFTL